MPSYNITVPAASPSIQYSAGNWTVSAAAATCTPQNASCSLGISFGGTGIVFQGSTIPGNYLVTIDGITEKSDLSAFGMIFAKSGLAPGPHVLDMHYSPNSDTDAEGPLKDFQINTVNILMGDGDTTTFTRVARLQATDSNFTYAQENKTMATSSEWTVVSIGGYQTFANISFYGNDIAVYGIVDPTPFQDPLPCKYNVSLDGDLALVSAIVPTNVTGQITSALLYQSANLTFGPHHVLITVNPLFYYFANGNFTPYAVQLNLEYADVHTYVDLSNNSTAHSSTPIIDRSSPPIAPIAGGVLGGLVMIAVTMTCAFYLLRHRFRRTRFTFVGEDGIDGGIAPARPEEDMPPPDYQRVFARDSEAPGGHVPAPEQRGLPNGRFNPSRALFRGKRERAIPTTQALEALEPQQRPTEPEEANTATPEVRLLPRRPTDPALLAWKEQVPQVNNSTSSKPE